MLLLVPRQDLHQPPEVRLPDLMGRIWEAVLDEITAIR